MASQNKPIEGNFIKIVSPAKKPVVTLFKKSESEPIQIAGQINPQRVGSGLQIQNNGQTHIKSNTMNQPLLGKTQQNFFGQRLQSSRKNASIVNNQFYNPIPIEVTNNQNKETNYQKLLQKGIINSQSQKNLKNGNLITTGGFATQIPMGSFGQTGSVNIGIGQNGLIFNPNLKNKFSKTAKIKSDFIKTHSKVSTISMSNNTASAQNDSEGGVINPSIQLTQQASTKESTNPNHPYNGFYTPSNNNYFIFNNIVQIQPNAHIQAPQFISGIFGSSIGGGSAQNSHQKPTMQRVFSHQDIGPPQILQPQQRGSTAHPLQQHRLMMKQQFFKKNLIKNRGTGSQRPQTRGVVENFGAAGYYSNQNLQQHFPIKIQNIQKNNDEVNVQQQRVKPSTGYGHRIKQGSGLDVNALLSTAQQQQKRQTFINNHNDGKEQLEDINTGDANEDDDLLSSIHSIVQQSTTNNDKQRLPGGLNSMRQFQFLRNDREEESCFNDLYSTLITNFD